MEVKLIGRNTWEKIAFLILVTGLIFVAAHKWSTIVRVVLQLGLFVYVVRIKGNDIFKSMVKLPLLPATAYVVFIGLSVPLSVNPIESIQAWVRLLEMFIIAVSVYHLLDENGRIRTGLFYMMLAFGAAYVMDIQWYLRHLGTKWNWGEIWDRPVNFDHHNTYSAICMTLAPVALTFLIAGRQLWMRIVMGVFLLLDIFLIYILQSRTAQISLVFMLALTGLFLSTTKRKVVYISSIALVLIVVALNIGSINPRWVDNHVLTGLGRTENWKNALTLIKDRPIIGYGYGRKVYRDIYRKEFGLQKIGEHKIKVRHAHSGYLDRLFANGLIGLLLFLWVIVTAFIGLVKRTVSRRGDWIIARALLLSLAGTLFYYAADIQDGVQWALMWVFLAISFRISAGMKVQTDEN